jgi:hypothetical protein
MGVSVINLYSEIEGLITRSNSVIPQQSRKKRVILYAKGLSAKVNQAKYALSRLSSFSDMSDDSTSSTEVESFPVTEQLQFYCDAFWAFLYSSLDVMAQLINQALRLEMDESKVSFNRVKDNMASQDPASDLTRNLARCQNSRAFKNLQRYRNCSIHRRQIYVEHTEIRTIVTSGYNRAGTYPGFTFRRILCDNPLVLTPTIKQERSIPEYLEDTLNSILVHICSSLRAIVPRN